MNETAYLFVGDSWSEVIVFDGEGF
jgi:hypothetical protein